MHITKSRHLWDDAGHQQKKHISHTLLSTESVSLTPAYPKPQHPAQHPHPHPNPYPNPTTQLNTLTLPHPHPPPHPACVHLWDDAGELLMPPKGRPQVCSSKLDSQVG